MLNEVARMNGHKTTKWLQTNIDYTSACISEIALISQTRTELANSHLLLEVADHYPILLELKDGMKLP